ncbi:MAG: DUF2889 domain-containing protein [Acidimicrobiales bacterium]|nr:DUF2889 domain-containing protein [Acidimicrobiales bacterium]
MAVFHRSMWATTKSAPDGSFDASAGVEDWLHGFAVTIRGHDDVAAQVTATSTRHPWTTCPGALASVTTLAGPVASLPVKATELPTDATCVHLNDLVWLASRRHPERRYDIEVTRQNAELTRDGVVLLRWRLADWRIDGTGRFRGLGFPGAGWAAALDDVGADDDLREAVRVMRRAIMVAMGYFELDWRRIRVGTDVPTEVMAETCHTFTASRVASATCLVEPPERRSGSARR